jgi:uncharacterized cupredoxin-like copper-binding protein
MRLRAWRRLLLVVSVCGLLALGAVACSSDSTVTIRPGTDGLTVIGHIGGSTTFTLLNDADRKLDAKVLALNGHSVAELNDALGHGGNLPDWVTEAGALTAEPGKVATATVDVKKGSYAIVELTGEAPLVAALTRAGEEASVAPEATKAVAALPTLPAAGPVGSATGTVNITMKEFSLAATPVSTGSGQITFSVKNDGAVVHELLVVRTEGDAAALPIKAGAMDEADPGVKVAGKIATIAAGASQSVTAGLPAGKYVLLCNVPGHYGAGMHTAFTVQ